jgi:hypothetical protein
MSAALNNKNDVCKFMDDNMVDYSFRGQSQEFLPSSALDEVTRKEVVQRLVAQDKCVVLSNSEEVQLVDRIVESGRKLFAVCVHCDLDLQHLKVMLDNGITDERLPLCKNDLGSLKDKRGFVQSFIRSQKLFNTIMFSTDSIQKLGDLQPDGFTIPIDYEETEANYKGKGAFGTVWKVKIHGDHRNFACVRSLQLEGIGILTKPKETNEGGFFAMKVTPHEGREQDYHRQMAGLNHSHLVKCLASFTHGAKYQMVSILLILAR